MIRRLRLICVAGLVVFPTFGVPRGVAQDARRDSTEIDLDSAIKAADEAIRRDPKSGQAYFDRGSRRLYRGSIRGRGCRSWHGKRDIRSARVFSVAKGA